MSCTRKQNGNFIPSRGGGAVGQSVRTASGRFGVRIPATADLSR